MSLKNRILELEENLNGIGINSYVCICGRAWMSHDEYLAQCCPGCGGVVNIYLVQELLPKTRKDADDGFLEEPELTC